VTARRGPIERIVLIHGAGHGAWCWDRVLPYLSDWGYRVAAPDLPGLGADPTPPSDVTFDAYVGCVVEALGEDDRPALLVGHSLGGAAVTQAAEDRPELVAKLLYLTAFLPRNGQSPLDLAGRSPSTVDALRDSAVEGAHEFRPELAPGLLYNRCDPDVAHWAVERLRPQAAGPVAAPVHISAERWGSIPKVYVVCTDDNALPQEVQQWMCDGALNVRMRFLDSDHSPFLSQPDTLAHLLHEEAQDMSADYRP
jgi:pimeloyl-ACP methyl ester carboxylesterase